MAVVKSNAYGHGLIECARLFEILGADYLGVDSVVEALALRRSGVKAPILVLGYTLPENITSAYTYKIILTISSFAQLQILQKHASKIPQLHLKIDTGMHRQGFFVTDVDKLVKFIKKEKLTAKITGVYSHLAAADDPRFNKETLWQLRQFNVVCEKFTKAGLSPVCHICATAGASNFKKHHFDLVRVGLGLYNSPKPTLTWKTVVGEVKKIKKGERVGYGLTEKVARATVVAICPIGYWHGYPRLLSSKGCALIHDQRVKVLGRVSMDMVVFDVTNVKSVKTNDEVVLLGRQGKNSVTAEELAEKTQTINYEFLTRLNPLMKRLYI